MLSLAPAGAMPDQIRPAHPTDSIRSGNISGHGPDVTARRGHSTIEFLTGSGRSRASSTKQRTQVVTQTAITTRLVRSANPKVVVQPVSVTHSARRNMSLARSAVGATSAATMLSRAGVAIPSVGAAALGAGGHSVRRVVRTAADALLDRAGARVGVAAVKRAVLAARRIRDDATPANQERVVRREESIPQIAQLRPDWRPPLQPWTDWEPRADRFRAAAARSLRSSGPGTFESSSLPSPVRRSDGSAEKRQRRPA
jgi:hypothetical protein